MIASVEDQNGLYAHITKSVCIMDIIRVMAARILGTLIKSIVETLLGLPLKKISLHVIAKWGLVWRVVATCLI